MSIDKKGFLGKDIQDWIKKHRSDNSEWFSICEELNIISHYVLSRLKVNPHNGQQTICSILLVKSMGLYQATLLLIERGMINEAKVLIRSLCDAVYALCAIIKDDGVMREYINDDIHRKIKYIERIKRHPEEFKDSLKNGGIERLEERLEELKTQKKKHKTRQITTEYLAERAGLKSHYNVIFCDFSQTVHSRVQDLEQYFSLDEKGNIKEFIWGPSVTGLDRLLAVSFEIMFIALSETVALFAFSVQGLKDLDERHSKLQEHLSEDTGFV